jgi:hypothetical protein
MNSISNPALSADLMSFLASRLSSEGIKAQSSAGEVTTKTADGGSITTIGTGTDAQIVSETSASGTTLTQVGYESPVLIQNFLNSLEQELQSDGLKATSGSATATSGTTSTTAADATTTGNTGLASSIHSLLTQLGGSPSSASTPTGLLSSFDDLLQGSGINVSAASSDTGASGATVNSALQAFLNNTLAGLSTTSPMGQGFNASA